MVQGPKKPRPGIAERGFFVRARLTLGPRGRAGCADLLRWRIQRVEAAARSVNEKGALSIEEDALGVARLGRGVLAQTLGAPRAVGVTQNATRRSQP